MSVAYPNELTYAYWDKQKGLLSKTKPTGIGQALKDLKKLHDALDTKPYESLSISSCDEDLKEWPEVFQKRYKPIITSAKAVQTMATKAAGDFAKSVATKGAVKPAQAVAEAARHYYAALEDYEGAHAKVITAKRKEQVDRLRTTMTRMFGGTINKVGQLEAAINHYCAHPTKEAFFNTFKGDGPARGYTTACKNWDQWIVEFPEIAGHVYKGKMMDEFLPALRDYGAEWSEADFEKNVNHRLHLTEENAWEWHAEHLKKQIPLVKRMLHIFEEANKLAAG